MRLDISVVLLSIALSILGCDTLNVLSIGGKSAPSDFPGQYIETNEEVYKWDGEGLVIEYTFNNPFDRTVYMAGCADGAGPAHILEKHVEGEWKAVYSRICLDRLIKPTEIGPGESYKATLELDKNRLGQRQWKADSVSGTYRFREPMYWEWSMEKAEDDELESSDWRSNEFEIPAE